MHINSHTLKVADLKFSQVNHDVRLDSALMLCAAREVVEEEGFEEMLDSVRARVDEIESLHRTNEVTVRL